MTRILFAAAASGALAACAPIAPPMAYMPPNGVTGGPLGTAYAGSVAPLNPNLRLCAGASAYNAGPIGWDNAVVAYRPFIETPAGPLRRNPTDGACLSSGYGWRATASGGGREHLGVDLANPHGGFIYAAAPGRVTTAGWRGTYGLYVELDHGRGVRTRYGHLSEINPNLKPGARLPGGVPLGRMGATGNATGVHLHYEVLLHGRHVDPLTY